MNKYMLYNENWKIVKKYEQYAYGICRYFYWKVDPKELKGLSLWQRLFGNRWIRFRRAIYDGNMTPIYRPDTYQREIVPIKTVGQALEYMRKQEELADEYYQQRVDLGEVWPKDIK